MRVDRKIINPSTIPKKTAVNNCTGSNVCIRREGGGGNGSREMRERKRRRRGKGRRERRRRLAQGIGLHAWLEVSIPIP